jgi:glycosyltransferase involved in cell wall biosynthesis
MKKIIFLNLNLIFSLKVAIVGLNLDGHGLSQISQGLQKIIKKNHSVDLLFSREKNDGYYDISIFTDSLTCFDHDFSTNLPKAKINIAYCLWETDTLPKQWVEIINNKFDAVIVSSAWYVNKYIDSGVNKPIFYIPLGLDEKKIELLKEKTKNIQKNKIFYFTCVSSFFRHKNQLLLLEAFNEVFVQDKKVGLILSGHAPTYDSYYDTVVQKIKQLNNPNIILNTKQLDDIEFAKMLNKTAVLVSVSTGEGYSYTPREAAALGIPTIVAANTAYWDIIENELTSIAVNCPELKPSYCVLQNDIIGNGYVCSKESLKEALNKIYKNYKYFKNLAMNKKEIANTKYSWSEIEPFIYNLLKSEKWFLSQDNKATKFGIFCSDKNLFYKLQELNT